MVFERKMITYDDPDDEVMKNTDMCLLSCFLYVCLAMLPNCA